MVGAPWWGLPATSARSSLAEPWPSRQAPAAIEVEEDSMPAPIPPPSAQTPSSGGLVRSRTLITAARTRTASAESDGGGTGRSDGND